MDFSPLEIRSQTFKTGIMGKMESSVLGKIKGKVGNLVFYELNGQLVVRKKASPKKGKQSDLQKYHQEVFRLASTFLRPFKDELNFTMAAFEKGGKKGFHQGMSWLLKNGILHGESPKVLPEQLLISMGSLTGAKNAYAEKMGTQEIQVSWEPNAWDGSARDGDKAYILIYDPIRLRVSGFRSGNYRKAGSQILVLPWSLGTDDKVWVYLSFYQTKNKTITFSNSHCLGLI